MTDSIQKLIDDKGKARAVMKRILAKSENTELEMDACSVISNLLWHTETLAAADKLIELIEVAKEE